ncbi:AzlD domain-containing protein [Schinkia azotoformans]|uniref:Branched-chain amino acid transport n=1 Tax=Schinkia azotoformans LMG 9581 TaxID=1131731 RepID=K6DE05_SCHAZ|nr:AzlD domain-containing protein [Schinkia azotoformans]EKN70772.1 branched-chain amino acid transport [Schinkia azotoformans LMG 9581]MEC1641112.1 AzlD domain-containing protein [Schinkia azotoformans]MEC1720799.1 AzlD domain-containing protein [Schinkia azotoformans]MEC1947555.1 AzlD domain-containing protein [Schinkia azotoformans]MED4354512.1 AzlD domain-containing protein [Schinkia azotoformans]
MNIYLLIILMAIVTYVPRALPSIMANYMVIPNLIDRWLKGIPFAVLGALIFPGILKVEPNQPLVGIAGGIIAVILSLLKLNLTIVLIGTVVSIILINLAFTM